MLRTPQQIFFLEQAVALLQLITVLDSSTQTLDIRAQRESALSELKDDVIPNLISQDSRPEFLFALLDARNLFLERFFVDVPAIVRAYNDTQSSKRNEQLDEAQQREFYTAVVALHNSQLGNTQRLNVAEVVDLLDPNNLSPLKILQKRVYRPLDIGSIKIPLASIVQHFPNGDIALLEQTDAIKPALVEGYTDVMYPAQVYYRNGDILKNVAVNLLDGSVLVIDPSDGDFIYGLTIDYGFDQQNQPLKFTVNEQTPAKFVSKNRQTFVRQPGSIVIPTDDTLIQRLSAGQDISDRMKDAIVIALDQIVAQYMDALPDADEAAVRYEVASLIPEVLAMFNILGFPLYPVDLFGRIFVDAVNDLPQTTSDFYEFVDTELRSLVSSETTRNQLRALEALEVDIQDIDVRSFDAHIPTTPIEVAFYEKLFPLNIFADFRNASFDFQLTPDDVAAINAGEDYTPSNKLEFTVPAINPPKSNQQTSLESWLEQEKKSRANEAKNRKSAMITLASFSAIAILGYINRGKIAKTLAL